MQNPNTVDSHATCRLYLELAARDLESAKQARDHYIRLSRRYGLTHQDIGDALGITESRVRAILAAS